MIMTIFKKSSIALITMAVAVSTTSVYAGGSEWGGLVADTGIIELNNG